MMLIAGPQPTPWTPQARSADGHVLQRKCACGAKATTGDHCQRCDEEQQAGLVQRSAANHATIGGVPPIVQQVLQSPGRPLDTGARNYMEPRFGRDFSQVQVHTDNTAAASANAIQAQAYTYGNQIVFGHGQYAPDTTSGRALLAHELAHTIQQQGVQAATSGVAPDRIAGEDDAEREAAQVAAQVVSGSGRVSQPSMEVGSRVRRVPWGACPVGTLHRDTNSAVSSKAERIAVGFYETGKPKELLVTNERPLRDNTSDNVLIQVAKGYFYNQFRRVTRGNRDESALAHDPQAAAEVAAEHVDPDDAAAAPGLWEAQRDVDADNSEAALKEPDLIDFRTLRIFDVTTTGQATGHGTKIQGTYARLLNQITEPEFLERANYSPGFIAAVQSRKAVTQFAAGESVDFPRPRVIDIPVSDNPADPSRICYGPTDLDAAGVKGVIQYQWIECGPAGCTSTGPEIGDAPARESYEVKAGGQTLTFQLEAAGEVPAPRRRGGREQAPWVALNEGPNQALAHSIPGLTFLRLQRLGGAHDKVEVAIHTQSGQEAGGLRLAIAPNANKIELRLVKSSRELLQSRSRRAIPFDFPGLSLGQLTSIQFDPATGLSGEGVIRPSIPLLRGAELKIAFSGEQMRLSAPIPTNRLRGLPGFRITEAGLNFEFSPEFRPSGTIAFEIGPRAKPVAHGRVDVSADSEGFLAQGVLHAQIPGMDEAQAQVTYRPQAGWQGSMQLRTSLSFVKSANVLIGLSEQGLTASGGVTIGLPGDQTVELGVERRGSAIVFLGSGEFRVPGDRLDPIRLRFQWDGESLTASGETGFAFRGFNGRMRIQYRDGRVSGEGSLDFAKGKARGRMNVRMSPAQRFSGDGEVTYQLTESLQGTAGIAIDESEKVTLKGALEFTRPIPLFQPFHGEREFFRVGINIPVPGASIGPIGIKARIEGALSAGYRIGPGELRNVRLETMLNPFEEDPDLSLRLSAQLYIGANAHVSGSISGGIMLDIGLASATGGLRVTATAELDGHVAADTLVEYSQDRFAVEGNLDVLLRLLLRLGLDAFARAEAGIGPFKVSTEREWKLAAYTFDPGLQLGMRTKSPLRYDSRQGLQVPSLDQIEIIRPNLNVEDMLRNIFSSGARPEVTDE